MFQFYFRYLHDNESQKMAIAAENVKIAKAYAHSIGGDNLVYTGEYDEIIPAPFENQQIAWICSTPADELPFLFKWGKKAALLFAYGTDCQCCLGYRIMAALLIGFGLGLGLGG